MSTIYADNNPVQTLVEKKKQQWAREREELADLNENALWGSRDSQQLSEKSYMRSRYVSKYQKQSDYLLRDSATTPPRRQSLPPLYKNQNIAYTSNEKLDKEMGGETSGYGSDNPNQTPEHFPQTNWNNHHLGYESSSSGREDRLKWGDRGVHVGKFWEPKEVDNFVKNNDTPGWVKRGLERDTELIVSNTSPAESPEQDYGERPCTSSSSQTNRCYIRGQNVPVEPTELAERERKRQIALSHQEAIRQQLEEREKIRQEERARKIREEYEEEMRIAREQELERRRQLEEQRIKDEKEDRERKRKEALREAIKLAEKEAREEKLKQKMMKQNINIAENVVEVEKIKPVKIPVKEEDIENNNENVENNRPNDNNQNYDINKNNNAIKNRVITSSESFENETNNNLNNNLIHISQNNNENNILNNNPLAISVNQQVSQENLAFVLQNPIESFQNAQFAVLIPTINAATNNSIPIAVPLPLYTDRSGVSTARTENRILTPTQYRNKRLCDSSTQTDFSDCKHQEDCRERYIREKMSNLEVSYERCRKERRSRSEMRDNFEERPKWGVNRPPTRYMKQSEKDPLYQRRKLRQKLRQIKVYDDKANSSDDSQTASPRTYRKKGYSEKRQARALWRKNEHLFSENVRVYQSEIVPLESDKDHIYFKSKTHHCCCRCSRERENFTDQVKVVDILKIEHNSPRECLQYKSEDKDKLPACNINNRSNVLENLSSLHHGLILKQDHWDETPRHTTHYSPSRNP